MVRKVLFASNRHSHRVDIQVFILTAFLTVLSCGALFAVGFSLTYSSMVTELRNRALSIHEFLDEQLKDEDSFYLGSREDQENVLYIKTKTVLEYIRSSAHIRYLYTAKRTEDGEFIYVVDGLPEDSSDFRAPGDPIEPECIPDMERALSGEIVLPESIASTTWGHVFISYFPMHHGDEIIGVLGMEFDAEQQYDTLRKICIATCMVVILVCLTAALTAVRMFRRISNPSFKDLANTDFLTGLKNRNAFYVDIKNMENQVDKGQCTPAIISIDMDGLKVVNDTGGHDLGDRYIQKAAQLLEKCLDHSDSLYRTGGDEFTALISESSAEELAAFMKRMGMKQDDTPGVPEVRLSAGYAIFDPEQDKSLMDTFRRADQNMYQNKEKRKMADKAAE